MNQKSFIAAVCAAAVCLCLGYASTTAYQDYKAKQQHDIVANDAAMIWKAFNELRGEQLVKDRIPLPDDGHKWETSLIYSDNYKTDPRQVQFLQWFQYDPRLSRLLSQTHHHYFTTSNPNYRARYAVANGNVVPAVIVSKSTGEIVYKASGSNIPNSAVELADQIADAIAEQRSDCRPHPEPSPTPSPSPAPGPAPMIPDIGPGTKPAGGSDDGGMGVIAALAAVAAGAVGYTAVYGKRKIFG